MTGIEACLSRRAPAPAPVFGGPPRFNFTGGHNLPEMVPVDALAEAAARAIRREGRHLATYNLDSGPLGHARLREFVARKLRLQRGIEGAAEDVLITTGSLQGLDLVCDLLLDPGDVVIMEQLTYAGTIKRVKARGAEVAGVAMDEEGLQPDALEKLVDEQRAAGRRVKALYTIPTIQNPTGAVMSAQRRMELLSLCDRLELPIIEDECYADLLWEGSWPAALRGMPGGDQVIHIGSFSKSIAPALRLGYISAPNDALWRLVALKNDGGTPAIEQMTIAELSDRFDDHVRELKVALQRKLELLEDALAREFGTAVETSRPKGGIFLWLTLPGEVDTTRLAQAAATAGVAFNPGAEWATDPALGRHCLRLCFAHPSEETIRDGVAELARICHAEFGVPARGANIERKIE